MGSRIGRASLLSLSVAKLKVPRQRKYYFVSKFKLKNLLVYFSFQSATDREVFREYFRFFHTGWLHSLMLRDFFYSITILFNWVSIHYEI